MNKKARSTIFNIAKVIISVGMLAYVLIFRVDLGALWKALLSARWGHLAGAILLAMAGVALRAVRWMVLLRAHQIDVPLGRLVRLYYVGTFFNIFLLSGFGGDAIRMLELSRHTDRTPEAIGTVLVDRATGLWVLLIVGLVALPFAAGYMPAQMVLLIGGVATAGVLGGWLIMGTRLVPWLGTRIRLPGQAKLERFYHAVSGCGYRALGLASAISLAFNLMNVTVNYLIGLAFWVQLPLGVFVAFAPILAMSLLLPSVGGLGVREEVHRLLYGTVSVANPTAVAMSLATFGVQTLLPGIVGALLYAMEGASGLHQTTDE